ncbi:MAG: DMT family transporter [Rhodobacteraceae bacterium]|jgi:drug/metabolite transporter (DMT)-like permease|nr:DMT family transporter [Paracoccaceae bacterium]
MELWVAIAIAASAVQTLRFLIQKRLRGAGLSVAGASFSRFLFGAPLALALAAVVLLADRALGGAGWPGAAPAFWGWAALGGVAQVAGTLATVALFSTRAFAVGIAFTKTETVLVALGSAVLLAEAVSAPALVAILTGLAGVALLSLPKGADGLTLDRRAAVLGLSAGAGFALAALSYRAAALSLGEGGAFLRASVTLAAVLTIQTAVMFALLAWREPGEAARVLRGWRSTLPVGLTGMLGSLMWFWAFALENAAHVRAVGQVELVFSILAGALVLGERITWREGAGIAILGLSVVALVLVA